MTLADPNLTPWPEAKATLRGPLGCDPLVVHVWVIQ